MPLLNKKGEHYHGRCIAHTALLGQSKTRDGQRASVASPSLPQPDVAACGRKLLEADTERRQRLARRSSLREEVLLAWLSFLLAIHDSGEFGDGFQSLRPNLLQALQGRRTRVL
jgi:CRISPR-associated nuclease/helicase Cas3-like protein